MTREGVFMCLCVQMCVCVGGDWISLLESSVAPSYE